MLTRYECGHPIPQGAWETWGCLGSNINFACPHYDRLFIDGLGNAWIIECVDCIKARAERRIEALLVQQQEVLATLNRIQELIRLLILEIE